MDSKLLECFISVAEQLHFGNAAQKLDMHPSALGRNVRLLEEELGVRLFARTTRNVTLTRSGHLLITEARDLLASEQALKERVRISAASHERVFRIGAIDSAATGLIPQLLHDFHEIEESIEVILIEDKSVRLLPKILSGALDLAIVRPSYAPRSAVEFEFLLDEATVVALPESHSLAKRKKLKIADLAEVPLIVPSPRTRPHSYNLTMRLFLDAGMHPIIAQQAEEKQTIVNMVGAEIGAALVPYWTSRIAVSGVVYRPLVSATGDAIRELPLAAAWVRGTKDKYRSLMIELLKTNLDRYSS